MDLIFTTTTVYSPLSRTTRVSRYQKKHSPAHTYPDHQSSFISFFHLLWSIASPPFNFTCLIVRMSLCNAGQFLTRITGTASTARCGLFLHVSWCRLGEMHLQLYISGNSGALWGNPLKPLNLLPSNLNIDVFAAHKRPLIKIMLQHKPEYL